MKSDFEHVAEALQFAVQMEVDGKQYYLKISGQCRNEVGKRLLAALAAAEDVHRKKFETIYEATRVKQSWPKIALPPAHDIRTVFTDAIAEAKPGKAGTSTEKAAVDKAIGMEIASYEYYMRQSQKAAGALEKGFYEAVAAEEHVHHMALLDYKEFLDDPAAWFVKTERPSLD